MFDLGESRCVRDDLATAEVLATEVLGTEGFEMDGFGTVLLDPEDLAKYDDRLPP
jgi:hypothetical protein